MESYTITSIAAVGLFVTKRLVDDLMKHGGMHHYHVLQFADAHAPHGYLDGVLTEERLPQRFFLYVPDTFTHTELSDVGMVDPNAGCEQSVSEYTRHKHMDKFFKREIGMLRAEYSSTKIGFWSILTNFTVYVGPNHCGCTLPRYMELRY